MGCERPERHDGFRVLAGDARYREAWRAFRSGGLPRAALKEFDRKAAVGGVYRIEPGGPPLVMKAWTQRFGVQEMLFRLTRPNYLFHLYRAVARARADGVVFTPAVRLVAERRLGGRGGWERFLLMDFVEGPLVRDLRGTDAWTPALVASARTAMENAHRYGLATDPHVANFIAPPTGGAVAIDLNGRPRSWLRTGRDHFLFESNFRAAPPHRGLNYRIAKTLHHLRARRRGVAPLPSNVDDPS